TASGPSHPTPPTWPQLLIKWLPGGSRFSNSQYQRLVARDVLMRVASEVLFQRMSVAAEAGDSYKALYLARVFTRANPGVKAGWTNRAKLAPGLGFYGRCAGSLAT